MSSAQGALRDLQSAFHSHLLGKESLFAEAVAERGGIDTGRRLSIYHHAYRQRLLETLHDSFEKTWGYLGDASFDAAALAYIEREPPRRRSLRWYGEAFPAWLESFYPGDLDIGELAMIDWQLRAAFDGADAPALRADSLQQLTADDWERLGFVFAPTLSLAPLRFGTLAIWHALDRDETPPPARPLAQPAHLLVWRKGLEPHFRSLDAIEHAALARMLCGASFADVCAALQQAHPDRDAAATAAAFLRQWFEDELIVGLSMGT